MDVVECCCVSTQQLAQSRMVFYAHTQKKKQLWKALTIGFIHTHQYYSFHTRCTICCKVSKKKYVCTLYISKNESIGRIKTKHTKYWTALAALLSYNNSRIFFGVPPRLSGLPLLQITTAIWIYCFVSFISGNRFEWLCRRECDGEEATPAHTHIQSMCMATGATGATVVQTICASFLDAIEHCNWISENAYHLFKLTIALCLCVCVFVPYLFTYIQNPSKLSTEQY